jgi:predicted tellurium resistance membrane protein TerC
VGHKRLSTLSCRVSTSSATDVEETYVPQKSAGLQMVPGGLELSMSAGAALLSVAIFACAMSVDSVPAVTGATG